MRKIYRSTRKVSNIQHRHGVITAKKILLGYDATKQNNTELWKSEKNYHRLSFNFHFCWSQHILKTWLTQGIYLIKSNGTNIWLKKIIVGKIGKEGLVDWIWNLNLSRHNNFIFASICAQISTIYSDSNCTQSVTSVQYNNWTLVMHMQGQCTGVLFRVINKPAK